MSTESPRNPYDIHFYFNNVNDEIYSSYVIKLELQLKFPWLKFYPIHYTKIGPHTKPMWEADFTNCPNVEEEYPKVVEWLEKNRRTHSVLIHPNTNDPYLDHTENAVWLGQPIELDLSKL
jgi:DOPA 4,5-dioxygenase